MAVVKQNKMVLIADPDREVLRDLGKSLHDRGYDVRAARDGSQALEKAILLHPDIILIEADCPLLAARKLVQILRSNPRTEHIPVVVMKTGESDEGTVWGYREASIRKPFNTDEVLSLVAATFQKMATAQEVREESREIEGTLAQISLVDLLQIFSLNRRTGMLELSTSELQGQVHVQDGSVVHASSGRHRGEKAIFRLLHWRDGKFAFIPGQVTSDQNIRRSTDMLLLDGARQADELARLQQELPAANTRLVAASELKERYEGLHPVTEEIMNLLEFYNTVGELVEHARASDFEAFRAIRTLLDKGVLRFAGEEAEEPAEEAPLLGHDKLYELKVKLARDIQSRDRLTRAKICVLCPEPEFVKEFVTALRKLPRMEPAGQLEALRRGFGHIGTLQLSDNLVLDWMLLPVESKLKPLWHPLGAGMVGGLVLQAGSDDQTLYRLNLMAHELTQRARVPLVQVSPKGSSANPQDGVAATAHVRAVVVELLHLIAQRPVPDGLGAGSTVASVQADRRMRSL